MKSRKHLLHRNWICPNIFWGCFLVFFISSTISVLAQEDKKAIKKAEHAHAKAQKANKKGEFFEAEAEFRKAISGNPDQMDSRYNLGDRKSTRLNSSHVAISYAVCCLKKKACRR